MKSLFLTFTLLFSATSAFSSDKPVELDGRSILVDRVLNGKRTFRGHFAGRDDFTLSQNGEMIFVKVPGQKNTYEVQMTSTSRHHNWRSNLVYPSYANVMESVIDENGNYMQFDLNGYTFELEPRDLTFYIFESDEQYRRRAQQLAKLGKNYEQVGKLFAIVEYKAFGLEAVDFFEILPSTNNQEQQQQQVLPKLKRRGTFTQFESDQCMFRCGHRGHYRGY